MLFIILLVAAVIVFFYFAGKKGESNAEAAEKPLTDKKLEKKLEKKLKGIREMLNDRYEGYSPAYVYNLQELARLTAQGQGVAQDTELACRLWEEAVDVALFVKIGGWGSSDEKFHSFDVDKMVDFFLDGTYVPRDPERAMGIVNKLIDAGEPKAVYLRQDIIRQQLPDDAPGKNEFLRSDYEANYQKYVDALKLLQTKKLLDQYAFQTVRLAEIEKLEPEFFEAGFDEKSAKGLPWLLKKIGWPAPGPAPAISRSQALQELIESNEVSGYMDNSSDYEELAEGGDVEAMRRAGQLLRDVCSSYPGSDEDTRGIQWLQKAADAGDALAQYLLDPKKTDASAMAALACTGNIEALYDLGHMVEKGYGGPASPAAAFMIWNMAWNLIGDCRERKDYHGMVWKYKLARARGDMREETLLFWCAGDVDKSGKFSVAGNYSPASYELQRSHFAERTENGYQWTGEEAWRHDYAKARHLYNLQKERDTYWGRYVERFYTDADRKTPKQEQAAYEKVERERRVCSIALSMPGLPDLELIRKGIIPDDIRPLVARAAASPVEQTAVLQENDCRIQDMPHYIFDEMNRRWAYTGVLGDAVKYCLENQSEAIPGVDSLDVLDDHVEAWISQRHIHGNTAETFTHTFHW